MIKPHADGGYAAALSIRSGRGQASHDRVMQFTPRFVCAQSALHYAAREGMAWANAR